MSDRTPSSMIALFGLWLVRFAITLQDQAIALTVINWFVDVVVE
ncbi:hypothetical protein [Nostoc sp.]